MAHLRTLPTKTIPRFECGLRKEKPLRLSCGGTFAAPCRLSGKAWDAITFTPTCPFLKLGAGCLIRHSDMEVFS